MPHQVAAYLTHWRGGPEHTLPVPPFPSRAMPRLRIAAIGDVGDSGHTEDRTAAAMAAVAAGRRFDALVLLGDNVYPAGDPRRLQATVFEPFGPVLEAGTRLFAILGNHDVLAGHQDDQLRALGMPARWWSARLGDVLLVGLDSNQPDNPVQRAWLGRTLATTTARWRVVLLHHPPYSSGYHGSSTAVRHAFSPVFERYGVQLVLSGHEHDYQRTTPVNGVTYIVSGAGSGSRRTGTEDFTAAAFATPSFLDVAVFDDHLLVRAIDQHARMFDQVVLGSHPGAAGPPG
jgi:predicted MPP superfamily phosphohydrolase